VREICVVDERGSITVVKLSVDDLTFSTGNIGLLIDPGTSTKATHRINDFADVTANVL